MGTEKKLTECPSTEARNHKCISAGVTCGNSTSESTILTKIGTLLHGAKCSRCIIFKDCQSQTFHGNYFPDYL